MVIILGSGDRASFVGEERTNRWHRYSCLFTISFISTWACAQLVSRLHTTAASISRLTPHAVL